MGKDKHMHNAAGKKILHPADAVRKQAKKRKLEKMKKERQQHFETKMFGKSPQEIEEEILSMKLDFARKKEHKIAITKFQEDRLTKLEAGYKKLKEQIQERHEKRMAAPKSNLHVDFEELKLHRKSSIFYHPITNPYGAPPAGQTLMYRHPDGSVKREPPPLPDDERPEAPGFGGAASSSSAPRPAPGSDDDDEEGEEDDEPGNLGGFCGVSEEEEDEDDDDDAEPMLPTDLPGGAALPPGLPPGMPPGHGLPPLPPGIPPGMPLVAGLPPLPFGPPPGFGLPPLPPGRPPLPLGQPPLPFGMPPLPLGQPPLPLGLPPLPPGLPALPAGMPPLPAGMPPLPPGQPPLPGGAAPKSSGAPASQAAFLAELQQAGFQLPAGSLPPLPPGPPPPRGSSPGAAAAAAASGCASGAGELASARPPGPPPKLGPPTVSELPAGMKAPPPPPKRPPVAAAAQPTAQALRAATAFVPTTLRTKRVSQLAGGVLQVSAASLSQEKRQKTLFTEAPRVAEKVNVEDAFADFMKEIG